MINENKKLNNAFAELFVWADNEARKHKWYYALDKKGRRLGLIHANSEEHAMEKARHEFGLAVIEVEYVEEEVNGRL